MTIDSDDPNILEPICRLVAFYGALGVYPELVLFEACGDVGVGLWINIRVYTERDRRFHFQNTRPFVDQFKLFK